MMTETKLHMPEFAEGLEGELMINEAMSKHTTWKTGGCADYMYTPASKDDLKRLLGQLPEDIEVYWIGLGSNLLVRDGGVRGLVLRTSKGLKGIEFLSGNKLYCESGVSCAQVARQSTRNGLTGVEFLAGVPGSFGGALAMNAGAFGGETWDWVQSIECLDRAGNVNQIKKGEIIAGYRTVELARGNGIISAILQLHTSKHGAAAREKIKSLLDKRSESQPIQTANAGSVFRNPQHNHAARLIEASGLKGVACGDAEISRLHANFIINRGEATSADIENLIQMIQQKVKQDSGIELVREVRIVGEGV